MLNNIELPKDSVKSSVNIVKSLLDLSRTLYKTHRLYKVKPGWNGYVEEIHVEARRAFKSWDESGRHKQGPLFEYKKQANAKFKYALHFIKRKENTMRSDSLARKLQYNSPIEFWKEIKRMNNCKTLFPTNIDGVNGSEEMTQLWQKHHYELFNWVKSKSLQWVTLTVMKMQLFYLKKYMMQL